jgi:hypothetical protein
LSDGQREIFLQGKVISRRNTLCISRLMTAALREKIRCSGGKRFQGIAQLKRERGE